MGGGGGGVMPRKKAYRVFNKSTHFGNATITILIVHLLYIIGNSYH